MIAEITQYLRWKKANRSRAGDTYRQPLMQLLAVCGDKQLEEYSIDDIVDYTNWMSARYANETVRYALKVVKNLFMFHRELHRRCVSPKLVILPRKRHANSYRPMQPQEARQILAAITLDSLIALRDFVIICVFWETGVRVSELCGRNIEHMDTDDERSIINTKKTAHSRIVKWSGDTNIYLKLYLREYLKIKPDAKGSDPFFINLSRRGKFSRLTPRSVERIIKQRSLDAGIADPTTPHGIRHGWGQLRRKFGASLKFIQEGLGHLSPLSSHTYQQYDHPEFEKEASMYLTPAGDREKIKIEELQHLRTVTAQVIPQHPLASN